MIHRKAGSPRRPTAAVISVHRKSPPIRFHLPQKNPKPTSQSTILSRSTLTMARLHSADLLSSSTSFLRQSPSAPEKKTNTRTALWMSMLRRPAAALDSIVPARTVPAFSARFTTLGGGRCSSLHPQGEPILRLLSWDTIAPTHRPSIHSSSSRSTRPVPPVHPPTLIISLTPIHSPGAPSCSPDSISRPSSASSSDEHPLSPRRRPTRDGERTCAPTPGSCVPRIRQALRLPLRSAVPPERSQALRSCHASLRRRAVSIGPCL